MYSFELSLLLKQNAPMDYETLDSEKICIIRFQCVSQGLMGDQYCLTKLSNLE